MSIKRYTANADNTIANAFRNDNFNLRATGSNAGLADVLETFSIYGRATTSSAELSRILVQFDTTQIAADRTAGDIPTSGSVSFYLRLFHAETVKTVPKEFNLAVQAVSRSWSEGNGLDLENYKDKGKSNWVSASAAAKWTTAGGDYHAAPAYSQTFNTGLEDLEIDVSELVEQWLTGSAGGGKTNYGVGIRFSSSFEASSSTNPSGAVDSFYTKRFFARGSEFFFKRPVIEARWNSSTQDDRGNFYLSSALAPAADNLNTLYLYNYVRGRLTNIPGIGTGSIFVNLFQTLGGSAISQAVRTPATGGFVSTGIYSCSVSVAGNYTTLRDVWFSGSTQYFTGSISANSFAANSISEGRTKKLVNITNLKDAYTRDEVPRFNVYVRERDWSPTIYTVASNAVEATIIPSASFRLYREIDGLEIIPHGTGSDLYTLLSYDVSGNYFNLDMSLLDGGYQYSLKFAFYDDERNSWDEQAEKFTFRVLDYEH